jgi:hypothetical protein
MIAQEVQPRVLDVERRVSKVSFPRILPRGTDLPSTGGLFVDMSLCRFVDLKFCIYNDKTT